MGIFDLLFDVLKSTSSSKSSSGSLLSEAINYGENKKDGSHDHRFNTGDDRTPAQKAGDKKKTKA